MDENTITELKDFVTYLNAKRLVHIVDSLEEGAGISVQEACSWMEYDVMEYLEACCLIENEDARFHPFFEELVRMQMEQDGKGYVDCRTEEPEDMD